LVAHGQNPHGDEIASSMGFETDNPNKGPGELCEASLDRSSQFLSLDACQARLKQSRAILNASLEKGLYLSSQSKDLSVSIKTMGHGESLRKGDGLVIRWGYGKSRWGDVVLGATELGVCYLGFPERDGRVPTDLQSRWPKAEYNSDPSVWGAWGETVISHMDLQPSGELPLHLMGTDFHVQVWKALLTIPPGSHLSYGDVAKGIKRDSSIRAVATAIGKNPVSYIIPCHRVISSKGLIHQYHWGAARKRAMLVKEILEKE
jgi:AraC family transcriptional regulator, regulatory protein of adaptative response / methylated-DNA-[protein]-cysteine methyltransferase